MVPPRVRELLFRRKWEIVSDNFLGWVLAGVTYGTGQKANAQHLSMIPWVAKSMCRMRRQGMRLTEKMHSCQRTDLFHSRGTPSKLPPAVEWKQVVLEQLGSVWIYLLKTVSDGSATLCKICKPCAKLKLVQTTREVENLTSARRVAPA